MNIKKYITKDSITAISLLFLFFFTYFSIGTAFASTPLFDYVDIFFGADTTRVILDLTTPRSNHARSVHPLLVLFFNPLGKHLTTFTGSRVTAALLLSTFFGGLTVMLFYMILKKMGFLL